MLHGVGLQSTLTEDHEALRLPPAPEPPSSAYPEQGQRLDRVRAEFRASWQAQIAETRDQAESARRSEERFRSSRLWLFAGGAGFGAYFAMLVGLFMGVIPGAVAGLVWGAVLGWIAMVPLALLSVMCEQYSRIRAEQLERNLRELERS